MNEFVLLSMWLDTKALHPVSDSAKVTGPIPSLDIDVYLLPVACAYCWKQFEPFFFLKKIVFEVKKKTGIMGEFTR